MIDWMFLRVVKYIIIRYKQYIWTGEENTISLRCLILDYVWELLKLVRP